MARKQTKARRRKKVNRRTRRNGRKIIRGGYKITTLTEENFVPSFQAERLMGGGMFSNGYPIYKIKLILGAKREEDNGLTIEFSDMDYFKSYSWSSHRGYVIKNIKTIIDELTSFIKDMPTKREDSNDKSYGKYNNDGVFNNDLKNIEKYKESINKLLEYYNEPEKDIQNVLNYANKHIKLNVKNEKVIESIKNKIIDKKLKVDFIKVEIDEDGLDVTNYLSLPPN
jgi:hypothetical protein